MERVVDDIPHGDGIGRICVAAAAMGAGALLMYLFDPDRGQGRRARLKDQVTSKANHLGSAASSKARDLRNRAKGAIHEVATLLPGERKSSNIPVA